MAVGGLAGQRALLQGDLVPDVTQTQPRRGLAVVGAGRPVCAQGHHLDEHLARPHEQEVRHVSAVHPEHGVAGMVWLGWIKRTSNPTSVASAATCASFSITRDPGSSELTNTQEHRKQTGSWCCNRDSFTRR